MPYERLMPTWALCSDRTDRLHPLPRERRPGAFWREREEYGQMPAGGRFPANFAEHTRHVPVGIGVIGLLPEYPLERGEGQFMVSQFRQHTAEAGPRLQMIPVEFDGGVIPLPCGSEITRTIQQLRQHEDNLGRRPLGLQHCPQRLGRLDEVAGGLQIGGKVEQLGGADGITRIVFGIGGKSRIRIRVSGKNGRDGNPAGLPIGRF